MALIALFLIVFGLNILPAFAPPTWMVLSALGFLDPQIGVWRVAVTAAVAATLGRAALAKLATLLVHHGWLNDQTRENIGVVKDQLAARPKTTAGVFLAYALSPFPSNSLFLAYGLTALPLAPVCIAFFVGRLATYIFWVVTAADVAHHVILDRSAVAAYFGIYFVLTQLFLLGLVYLFAKIDWKAWLMTKRIGLLRRLNGKT